MSQAGILKVSTSILPPSVPTSFETLSGTGVPLAHVLLVKAYDITDNNDNGITTKGNTNAGDPPGTGAINDVDIYLTNRITGTGTTTDDITPATMYTFPLSATPATYLFTTNVTAYNVTDSISSAYVSHRTVKTNGVIATLISAQVSFLSEEGAMIGVFIENSIVGNSLTLYATGLAAKTIHYKALTTYITVG